MNVAQRLITASKAFGNGLYRFASRPVSSWKDREAAEGFYIDVLGLSEREFALIKEQLEPGSRMFLVKQGHHSVVCGLDLKGFDSLPCY